ncbi:MAG TPA: decaprenyl-phosphate phosphoribosyltransferase [Anaerolineaceae bacterium]|nr:decaprenyl-phosphate phosphoribosyltransferase [Anaerolineaceae bacterium]HOE34635.1 decaprenyl-phosphate phosphoribosyltransferase [Anaerolineaceae bacterium]HOT24841.1 decaprenyl-phosphate phosphoribosyltransferase [Anaerolineaceae bacterium]HQH57610.1 decaprenyl-phosphate phosphoribosyltransferase [Anaerolineaceae bacterium]HQK03168.1 decaprenyl-phosphate phosphoribosyltransferase [Anaerolineaceae bacterium]
MRAYLETLRPRQWIKNLVIFAGLVFDRQLLQPEPLLRVAAAVILFCLVSGLTYTINDILDVESDRMHPQKKNRPIASGKLSPRKAGIFAAALSLFTFPAAFALSIEFGIICLVYTALMLSYSKWLKKIILIDVMVIALGFVLRVAAGVMVIKVNYFSPWLFVLTTLLALYLGFGKRLSEIKLLENQAGEHREVLYGYTVPLLNNLLVVVLSGILITYCLYTFSSHPDGTNTMMMFTIPFVLYGIFRYMVILENSSLGSSPEEVLLNDLPLKVTVFLWALSVVVVLYLFF